MCASAGAGQLVAPSVAPLAFRGARLAGAFATAALVDGPALGLRVLGALGAWGGGLATIPASAAVPPVLSAAVADDFLGVGFFGATASACMGGGVSSTAAALLLGLGAFRAAVGLEAVLAFVFVTGVAAAFTDRFGLGSTAFGAAAAMTSGASVGAGGDVSAVSPDLRPRPSF